MASLSAHFTRPDEHDRLRFHPQCPRCRAERLEGSLIDGPVVPLRAQAAIAVGVLACTSLAPTAAFATGVDDEIEGTAAPGQLTPDVDSEGELDATAESESEPTDTPSQPTEPQLVDESSDEPPPAEPVSSAPQAGDTIPAVPDEQPTGAVEAAPAPPAEPQPIAAPAAGEALAKHAERERAKSRARAKSEVRQAKRTATVRVVRRQVRVSSAAAAPAPGTTVGPAPTAPAAPAPEPRTVAVAASETRVPAGKAGDESHVVQQGESLWSIAADVLADGASPAQVAREVNRLWERNKNRIGTGDRNLLMAGTRLELR